MFSWRGRSCALMRSLRQARGQAPSPDLRAGFRGRFPEPQDEARGRRPAPSKGDSLSGPRDDPRAHDRRAPLGQRQDDGDARPLARVQAAQRRCGRAEVRPRLYRPGLSRRGVGPRRRQPRLRGRCRPSFWPRLAAPGDGRARPCAVRSVDGAVRRRSGREGRAARRPTSRRRWASGCCWSSTCRGRRSRRRRSSTVARSTTGA